MYLSIPMVWAWREVCREDRPVLGIPDNLLLTLALQAKQKPLILSSILLSLHVNWHWVGAGLGVCRVGTKQGRVRGYTLFTLV